jgi:surfeit locus 1 family protein
MIRFKPMLAPTLWLVPGLVLLIGLGVWQLQRLGEKESLIASVQAGMQAAPVPLAALLPQGAAAEWRHVVLHGHFLHDREAFLFGRGPMSAVGVHVVTPFVGDDGATVLVDRGFVPEPLRDPKTRAAGQIAGETTLTGVLRMAQKPGLFTPDASRQTRLWFVKDVPDIAAALGVTVTAPVIVEADATPNPGGWPLGGQTVVDFPNDHLQYALTWFGLALALMGVYLVYHRSRGRLGFG